MANKIPNLQNVRQSGRPLDLQDKIRKRIDALVRKQPTDAKPGQDVYLWAGRTESGNHTQHPHWGGANVVVCRVREGYVIQIVGGKLLLVAKNRIRRSEEIGSGLPLPDGAFCRALNYSTPDIYVAEYAQMKGKESAKLKPNGERNCLLSQRGESYIAQVDFNRKLSDLNKRKHQTQYADLTATRPGLRTTRRSISKTP